MELGIFSKTFERPTLSKRFDAVKAAGVGQIQFNWSCAGLHSMPEAISEDLADEVRRESTRREITIDAVSGTFNMAHPDELVRAAGLRSLRGIAERCETIGTSAITLCTGTRDRENMWKRHPDNGTADAWRDLTQTMEAALRIADRFDVVLGIEPEPANVISNAFNARDLLREMNSPRLKIILDPANIVAGDFSRSPETVLEEAFELLGDSIAMAHGKDVTANDEFCAVGKGIVPWQQFASLLGSSGFDGPIILHGLSESEISDAVRLLNSLS
jgi:sugar phosphate isomerase/epimerase